MPSAHLGAAESITRALSNGSQPVVLVRTVTGLEQLAAQELAAASGAVPPSERVDWRVVLDGKVLWVGVRPFDVPLHRRDWRRQTVPGSLHPPVAAAMACLAEIAAGQSVVDPFCGAGTVLLEARAIEPGATYLGIDQAPAALAAARANGFASTRLGDAADLGDAVDRIVTNPPWDVRVRIGDFSPYLRAWRRILQPDGRVVALLNQEQAAMIISDPGWRVLDVYDVAVAGRHPRIVVATCRTLSSGVLDIEENC